MSRVSSIPTISSLSCLPPTTSTPSSLKSSTMDRHLLTTLCITSKEAPYTQLTSCTPSHTSKPLWWPILKKKKAGRGAPSSGRLSRSSEETTMQETVRQTSLTPLLDQFKGSCWSTDEPQSKTSSTGRCSSMKTLPPSIPPPLQPWPLTMSHSSSPTQTSSYPHEPVHPTQSTPDHLHLPTKKMKRYEAITNPDHLP